MTREELREKVAKVIAYPMPVCPGHRQEADAVIRLVVEACCERVTAVRNRLLDDGFSVAASGAEVARNDLIKTFLPPEARNGEADRS